MSTVALIGTWLGRIGSAIIVLGVLAFFGIVAYGAWWDRREQRRRDVEAAREIGRKLLCGMDEPDPEWVERLRRELVAEARKSGYVQ